MRTDTGAVERSRTFTETARRAQIVDAAIATISEVGYRNASFARIAKRAGLSSTGLISYHFDSRDDLIGQVVGEIVGAIGAFMAERMSGVCGPPEALRAYIEGNVEFIGAHQIEMKALVDIFTNGGFGYHANTEATVVSPIEGILRAGQASGEFRAFDAKVMATLIQRAIDGLPFLLAADPEVDIAFYATEVVTVFDLATRAQP